ncbi:unnamed protein product [Malus baccata var. baccata]
MASGLERPNGVIGFQILSRLSAKSLKRSKCVCKSWSFVTRNPSFVNAHRKFYCDMQNHLLLTTWAEPTRQQHFFSIKINQEGSPTLVTDLLKLPTPPSKNVERLYGALSINGFVCLYLSDTLFTIQTDHNHPVQIFKPCTRECIVFPHYKVLQIIRFQPLKSTGGMSFMFFKLGTSSWRRIEVDINDLRYDPLKCQFGRRTVFIHGAIHWMHDSTQNIIAVFDPEDERFRVIPFPKDYDYGIHGINDKQGNIFEMEGFSEVKVFFPESILPNDIRLKFLANYNDNIVPLRLPSKSLMRFKCVCKSWSSLTQNPSFVEAHHHFGRNKYAHLLLTTWDQATSQQHFFSSQIDQQGSLTPATHVLTLPTLRTNGCLYTAQSINGLVCLYLQVMRIALFH